LSAINDAITSFARIRTVGGTSSFIQTSIASFQTKVNKVFNKKSSLKSIYAPIMMSLATLSNDADPSSVEKIINLMNKIKTALKTSLLEDQDNEARIAADWVTEKATI
jgi:hypothetical protein